MAASLVNKAMLTQRAARPCRPLPQAQGRTGCGPLIIAAMPAYAFEALDNEGATQKGVIEADTAKAARGLLRTRALVPLEVRPVAASNDAGGANIGASRPRRGAPSRLW